MRNKDLKFKGLAEIMLYQYFKDKELLAELNMKSFFEEDVKDEIKEVESRIKFFISSLNRVQLKQLIYMSLDFDDITDESMLKYGQ